MSKTPANPDEAPTNEQWMPQAEAERIVKFCSDICHSLRLDNWTIQLTPEPSDEDCLASVVIIEGRHVARVSVCRDWTSRTDEQQVNVLVHEMLHVAHHRLTDVMYKVLPEGGYVPRPALDMLHEAVRLEAELLCDHLAGIIGDFLLLGDRWRELSPKARKKAAAKAAKRPK